MFCKTCGRLLAPETTPYGKWMACPDGHPQPELNQDSENITSKNNIETSPIQVSDGRNLLAVHHHVCKKCGHDKAELIEIAPFYSDEDFISRMKCGQCGFTEQLEGKIG
jgi:DNA-directed RNA polymerase subunit M/transcription elongation factor TFIIS